MKTLHSIPTTLAAAALVAGCVFNDADSEAGAKVRFDVRATAAALAKTASPEPGLVVSDSLGLDFTVTEARAFIGKVKLIGRDCGDAPLSQEAPAESGEGDAGGSESGDGDCGDAGNVLTGPFMVDLLTGASTPAMGELEVPAGTYRKVKIHLDHAQAGDAIVDSADPLMGHTLYVKGTYMPPGGETPADFSLMLKFNEEVEMQSLAGMRLDAETLSSLLVTLKVGDWLAGSDVASCLGDPDVAGSLANGAVITESSPLGACLDAEKVIKRNIRASFAVEK